MKRRNAEVGQRVEHKPTGSTGEIVEVAEELRYGIGVKLDNGVTWYYKPKHLRRIQ